MKQTELTVSEGDKKTDRGRERDMLTDDLLIERKWK